MSTLDTASTVDEFQVFTWAVLALHDVLPAAGGQPARCRSCGVPPGDCAVWSLSASLLGITPTGEGAVRDR